MSNDQPQPCKLLGRTHEREVLDELVGDVRGGQSRSLVLCGEAGIGKTALLEYLSEFASDLTVARAVGVQSEMELPYASLHQLCAQLPDRIEELPGPQGDAVRIAFGLTAGASPDRFLVGLAVLGLLSEVAEERPLLCLVDDAQWLDQASARTLAFVARRLLAEPVGLIFAARDPGAELDGLPQLELQGLENDDAQAILATAIRAPIDARIRDRIVAETRGNPLALLELPRGLTATQLAGGFGLLDAAMLSERIEKSFEGRVNALTDDVRRLLVIAAADPVGDPLLLWGAAQRLGISAVPLTAADTNGLLSVGGWVTFRHPLVRSAVYRGASSEERRAVHLALAEATDAQLDPDRRAWHRAAAAAGPDEGVAIELEQSAGRAQSRGGFAAAAAFLERSVALSADAARRTDRALAAAEASLNAGALDTAKGLLSVADAGSLDDLQGARLELLRAQLAYAESRGNDAPPLLLRAARALERLDPKLALDTYLDAWSAALFAGGLGHDAGLGEVSRAVLAAPRATADKSAADLLLQALSLLVVDGQAAATPLLRQAVQAFAGETATAEEVLRWGWLASGVPVVLWEYEAFLAIARRNVELARGTGALPVLAVAVNLLCQAVALKGSSREASHLVSEAQALTDATNTPAPPSGVLVAVAFKGREPDASHLIDAAIERAAETGQGLTIQFASWARSVVLNGHGRYREALAAARAADDDGPEQFISFVSGWARIEMVEAAARCGDLDVARSALGRLTELTHGTGSDWGLGVEARLRALVSDGEDAEALYREAVERLGRTQLRPEVGRARLLYGEWLRREGRRVDARAELRAAHDLFAALGMEAFGERARRELLATGETVRKRTLETSDDLTPQEHHVATLARDGLSNPEIAARLFLSRRTVEWHLRKVFAKLEIRSRAELAAALPDSDAELLSA